ALFVMAGDVTVEGGQAYAKKLIDGWKTPDVAMTPPPGLYEFPPIPQKRQIILVDNPDSKGSTVRMAVQAYSVRSDDKYAGTLAGQILTSGIDSRLNRYVRAERGLSYGVHGVFQPNRHGGAFEAGTDGAIETAAESAEAIFHVLEGMRSADVTPKELNEAKTRTIGLMLMGMQTIQQQSTYRVEGILNDYPADYYDVYPEKISQVSADQVRQVMNKYVDPTKFTIVVVAPAEKVKAQLEKVGEVKVVPMPAKRDGGEGDGGPGKPGEMLKPATKPAA
ncbi:MAG: peptidase domain protein, partial [Phycisphaerales bacterium]|nr:peptidase domain protein [Phycisphaerales bacterium]